MIKTYVIDTNVFLHDPKSLFSFKDNEVVIPLVVLDELDKKKTGHDEVARHARETIRMLDEMRAIGSIHQGVKTESGGIIRVEINHKNNIPSDLDPDKADNRIISVALGVMKDRGPNHKVTVVSKDINLRVKCDALCVSAEDYNTDAVADNANSIYSGIMDLVVADQIVTDIHANGHVAAPERMYENQYVLLRSDTSAKHSALTRFKDGNLVKINPMNNIWGISPRNKEQACAIDALFNPDIKLVTLIGSAGSGKTLIATAAGISQLIDSHTYRKMIVTRPIVPMGKDIGYLPGDVDAKLAPWMAPIQDNLELLFSDKGGNYIEMYREQGIIEVEALTYIRGRSIPRSYIIVDECLTAGHQVSMADGTVKLIENIVAGDSVLSLDMKNNRSVAGKVEGVISRTTDRLLDIKTSSGKLECTENHPMYTFRDFNYTKKVAADLRVGDFIPTPKYVPHEVTNNVSENLAYFVGMILTDGHVEKSLRTIKVAVRKDVDHFKKMFTLGAKELNCEGAVKFGTNSRGDSIVRFHRVDIISRLSADFNIPAGNKSHSIIVPDKIFTAPLPSVKAFISACLDADGDINITNSGSLVINYSSVSEQMVIGMQHLLRKFGINSSIYFNIKKVVNGIERYIHRVCLTGINAYDFWKKIGFSMERKQCVLSAHFSNTIPLDTARIPIADTLKDRLRSAGIKHRDALFYNVVHSKTISRYMINERYNNLFSKEELNFINSYNFSEIKGINKSNNSVKVYDFKVKDFGTFCVNGMISSNCQNLTRHEVKTIITRVGEDSKIVLTGDILQIDNPFIDSVDNGLSYVVEKFKNDPIAAHITLHKGERSELATKAAELL